MTRCLPPSTLTLAGLVKHLALVEDHYFTHQLLGQPYPEVWAPSRRTTTGTSSRLSATPSVAARSVVGGRPAL